MFKVPFGDLKSHYLSLQKDIDQAVQRTLNSGHYILGPELEKFERDFAAYLDNQAAPTGSATLTGAAAPTGSFVVGCASGTEAIYLALAAAGVEAGDEVITVSHTSVCTILAISMAGAKPVFVDVHPDTYVMNVQQIEAKINTKTKAIIPVHLYGQMVDMNALKAVAGSIPIIEDTAQATGAESDGYKAGTIGQFGAFSFYPSKNLGAFGDGGAVVTHSKESYERLLMLRNIGQSKRYYHDIVAINSRMDELQAAILGVQLPHLDKWNKRRQQIAHKYTQELQGIVKTPVEVNYSNHVYHLYVIQCNNRDELQSELLSQGIQTLIHFPVPNHLQKAYAYLGHKQGELPVSEAVTQRILSLPVYPELTDDQVDLVIDAIRKFQQTKGVSQVVTTPNISNFATPIR